MTEPVIHGVLLALGLILPLGVQNVFVFNQGVLHKSFFRALPVIITASLCDTLLILLAVFGVSFILLDSSLFMPLLIGAGVIFLFYMGWMTWNSSPENTHEDAAKKFTFQKQVLFAASVSLLNPHAILDTVGVIGPSSLRYEGEDKIAFALACIIVSWLWFSSLALAGRFSGKLDKSGRYVLVLNKLSALVMWAAAIYLAVSAVW
ncbi:L-lysine exporter family protein LysE/ArgO [Evansella caseinilytica]|uniref:L-lysine exporter family protein LysE/ArgO n=1 Tax=Evansella caseinilytica TaxID=1503961 RepID=A0A1H3STZ4_9BACI|nr:LysE/ArgO family amino acid transporter [Evansella caseinilytica]SDZ41442.1 L-lysine exporter family protein LysE/ArgO [Evansella caseinilytica]